MKLVHTQCTSECAFSKNEKKMPLMLIVHLLFYVTQLLGYVCNLQKK